MFDAFFQKYINLLSLPLRAILGTIILLHGYSHIASGEMGDLQFILSFVSLFCGLAIVFGFFTRFVAIGIIVLTLIFWFTSGSTDSHSATGWNIETPLLMIATAITLVFTGSGKLSLENYFGFK